MCAVACFAIVFAAFAQDRQTKLAVMEMEDRSGKLDKAMLENAAEYLRSELAATNKFILISKDRQRKAILKGEKKESWKECYDQSCRIELGQAVSADTITYGSITLFGGSYTVAIEMIDLAKEATVKAAKAEFDGTEKGLKQALDDVVSQLVYGRKLNGAVAKGATETVATTAAGGINSADIYNTARDKESTDKERALELYNDIVTSSDSSDKYHQKAKERLIKLGDTKFLVSDCAADSAPACNELGNDHMKNKRFKEAAESYAKACLGGSGWGCYGVAERFLYGEGVPKDLSKARELYTKSCELNNGAGCRGLGIRWNRGEGGPQDPVKAREAWTRSCELKDGEGCRYIGIMWNFGQSGPQDPAKARELYTKACELNDGWGCNNIADLCLKGEGGPQDKPKARELYTKACDLNVGFACYNFAVLWYQGEGGLKDQPKARGLFAKACGLNIGEGCFAGGLRCRNGEGGPQDPANARDLYGKACDLNNGSGCARFGILWDNGTGGPKDEVKAREILTKACALNDGGGCNYLGVLWVHGLGGPESKSKAHEYFKKACSLGIPKACEWL